ncbi:hypothetical protein TRIP_C60158 [Candidatus Zixiibacteriota bacterium]|nr:hypothetical protein TRIP_C60158 [candidate division Zixibacteria bacterium]
MPSGALKVRVSTPTETIPFGRGFYQLEEDALYLPIAYPGENKNHFFSFLESDFVSMQMDREGRLIFIELSLPRRRWHALQTLVPPESAAPGNIRFLDFRQRLAEPSILCDLRRQYVMIRFSQGPATHNYSLAQNMIAQIDRHDRLAAIWVSDIIDDIAGQELSAWRKAIRNHSTAIIAT